jgi:CRISPR system Cascade subunit CasE
MWAYKKTDGREDAYNLWLQAQVNRQRGIVIAESRLRCFRLENVFRRTQAETVGQRKNRIFLRPAAVVEGTLDVIDPDAFQILLRDGVGRHRSFGFGMLLLRRIE